MAKKKEEGTIDIEETYSKAEENVEKNKNQLTIVAVAIIAIVGGYIGYTRFYLAPQEEEAQQLIWTAQQNFEADSFQLALNGNATSPGFNEIMSNYGMTKAGNLSNYYAGLCNLHLGNYQEAITLLEEFDSDDEMLGPIKLGAIGDCYSELGNYDKAIEYYEKAANLKDNGFTTPVYLKKAAILYENKQNYAAAKDAFEIIKKKYPDSDAGAEAEKYIARYATLAGE